MQNIDKNLKIFIFITALFIISIAILGIRIQSEIENLIPTTNQILPLEKSSSPIIPKATLIIDDGTGNPQSLELEISEKSTTFDLLTQGAKKLDLVLKTKDYDIGVFIEAIGEKENGEENKYWLYYVNGEFAQLSVDKKELKPEDRVEFKFEPSPF